MKRFDIDGNPEHDEGEVIFASALHAFEPIHDGEDIIFASALPRAAEAVVVRAERAARPEPVGSDVDRMWAAFDAEIGEELDRGLCPHCQSPLVMDLSREQITCSTCSSTYASFHAWARQGNA